MPDLPEAVHLITQAPQLNAIGLLSAVSAAAVAIGSTPGKVAVFHQIFGILQTRQTQIDRHHRLHTHPLAVLQKFIGAHLVRLNGTPGKIRPVGTLLPGTDTVLPQIAGHEITAGIPDQRHPQLVDQLLHIPTEPLGIRRRMIRLIDTGIHRPSHLLDKRAKQPGIGLSDRKRRRNSQHRLRRTGIFTYSASPFCSCRPSFLPSLHTDAAPIGTSCSGHPLTVPAIYTYPKEN